MSKRRIVDGAMTVLLLCLMAYQVTGETLHEWLGVGMTALVIVHQVLNHRWYGALRRGKYPAYRVAATTVNLLLLAVFFLTALCGMSMSGHAVPFLYGLLRASFARRAHLSLSHWAFVLMGLHLGLHLPAMTAGWKGRTRTAVTAAFTLAAGAGLCLFLRSGMTDYLFLRVPFAFLDYDKAAGLVLGENLLMLLFWAFVGAQGAVMLQGMGKQEEKRNGLLPVTLLLAALLLGAALHLTLPAGSGSNAPWTAQPVQTVSPPQTEATPQPTASAVPSTGEAHDSFVLIRGGAFLMGSPEEENWRIDDETRHPVTVSSFYMDPCEITQGEYRAVMGENPSTFPGDELPVENLSWLDAIAFANAKSVRAGLTPAYTLTEGAVTWARSADGYRFPTEAEWEYACRAGTVTPFHTQHSLSAAEANFYGHYPYEIEENYFNSSALEDQHRQARPELSGHYSGGATISSDVTAWLNANGLLR